MPINYQVVVGDVGTVYEGDSEAMARHTFYDYIDRVQCSYGRVALQTVRLISTRENGTTDEDTFDPMDQARQIMHATGVPWDEIIPHVYAAKLAAKWQQSTLAELIQASGIQEEYAVQFTRPARWDEAVRKLGIDPDDFVWVRPKGSADPGRPLCRTEIYRRLFKEIQQTTIKSRHEL